MSTQLRVALNMSHLSIPEKIALARTVANAITIRSDVFASPGPALRLAVR